MKNNKSFYYVYRMDRAKHNEYAKRYRAKHKEELRAKYREFRAKQIQKYRQFQQFGDPVPYKYLTQKDKKAYRLSHNIPSTRKPVKKGLFRGLFGGKFL